jgi:hypothetical protein
MREFEGNFGSNPQNLKFQKMCRVTRIRKKTFDLQFCMGTHEGHQKSIFKTSKVTKFAGSTQNHKKIIVTPNHPIETKKISN